MTTNELRDIFSIIGYVAVILLLLKLVLPKKRYVVKDPNLWQNELKRPNTSAGPKPQPQPRTFYLDKEMMAMKDEITSLRTEVRALGQYLEVFNQYLKDKEK